MTGKSQLKTHFYHNKVRKEWLSGFMTRQTNLSVRHLEFTSLEFQGSVKFLFMKFSMRWSIQLTEIALEL